MADAKRERFTAGEPTMRAGDLFSARRVGSTARIVMIKSVHHRIGEPPHVRAIECHRDGKPYGGARGAPFTITLTYRGGRWLMPDSYDNYKP